MIALLLSSIAALGALYLFTALGLGWRGLRPDADKRPTDRRTSSNDRVSLWLAQAGVEHVELRQFLAVVAAVSIVAAALTFAAFGGALPALFIGLIATTFPFGWYRNRRKASRDVARTSWPVMIEEVRLLTGSLGRSVPMALLEVGKRGPEELRPAFAAAEREWLLTTDFNRCADVLKERLGDATADVVIETLLIAHELGGADLSRRLEALAEDRSLDLMGRKDAAARLAGARFARLFVIGVPLGMAGAGMAVGSGRSAYTTTVGQLAVVAALALIVLCWFWAGRIMALPEERRVFG